MRLTYATLATLMKYPCSSYESENRWEKGKFSYFISEKDYVNEIAQKVGLIESNKGGWHRHPLAYLVEAADDICYRIADLEDGIEMQSYTFKDYENLFKKKFIDNKPIRINDYKDFNDDKDSQIAYIRSKVITDLAKQAAKIFIEREDEILSGSFNGSLLDYIDDKDYLVEAKRIASEIIFKHEKNYILKLLLMKLLVVY